MKKIGGSRKSRGITSIIHQNPTIYTVKQNAFVYMIKKAKTP
jgi:hypothetical protein